MFAHDDTVHINGLYVRPEFRREGIGVGLLSHAESWGEDQGCGYATLNVDRWNESAQTHYREEGRGEAPQHAEAAGLSDEPRN